MLESLVTAIRTLTIFPIPGKDAKNFSNALFWFPVVGFLLAILIYPVFILFGTRWPQCAAALILALLIIFTRGFHLDGLADAADGLFGGYTKKRRLEIMKDSHIGAFGVVALIIVLLLKWIALTKICELNNFPVIAAALIISRTVQVELAASMNYARKEGTACFLVNGANNFHRIIVILISLILLAILCYKSGIIALIACWLAAQLLKFWFKKSAGGITGDLLGASSEITETLSLILLGFLL